MMGPAGADASPGGQGEKGQRGLNGTLGQAGPPGQLVCYDFSDYRTLM